MNGLKMQTISVKEYICITWRLPVFLTDYGLHDEFQMDPDIKPKPEMGSSQL